MQLYRLINSIILIFFLTLAATTNAQNGTKNAFIPPLNIPLLLSGNIGEIRSNHLHSGLDFRTCGISGLPVMAAEDGYISRIKIEPGGFGKAIYIIHKNGFSTVYGHLSVLRSDLDSLVFRSQYQHQSFSTDVYFKPNQLPVRKGEFIALSGNAGGSMGPHLHFEIRNSAQAPLNIQRYYQFLIKDTIAPELYHLWIYPMDSVSRFDNTSKQLCLNLEKNENHYKIEGNQPVKIQGNISFGIETLDFMNDSKNTLGVYSIEVFVDGEQLFGQYLDKLSFAENRMVNSMIDYGYYVKNHVRINRLWVEPNNRLSVYRQVKNAGILAMNQHSNAQVKIVVKDANFNTSELTFRVTNSSDQFAKTFNKPLEKELKQWVKFSENAEFAIGKEFQIQLPANSFYTYFWLRCSIEPKWKEGYSKVYHVKNEGIPFDKSVVLKIQAESLPLKYAAKALLVRLDSLGNPEWYGGGVSGNVVSASIRNFGRFAVTLDTLPPIITPLNSMVAQKDFSSWGKYCFKVVDTQSGLASYQGKIDGEWVVFEYDEKQDLIFCQLDSLKLKEGKRHLLNFYAVDKKGNKAEFHSYFFK